MITRFIQDNFKNRQIVTANDGKRRIEFIDLAKGICILMVVVYHTEIIHFDIPGLKALRMPLYFILSGLFFKTYGGVAQFALKKTNKILIPFLFFYVISWIEMNLLDMGPWLEERTAFPLHALFTQRIGAIWFLECLFFTGLLFCIISVTVKKEILRAVTVFGFGTLGYYLSIKGTFLPCQFDAMCSALPFFYFGYILKKSPILYPSEYDRYALPAGLLLVAIGSVLYYVFEKPHIEFWNNTISNGLVQNYILSFLFVMGVLLICKRIKWLPVISYIGRFSIIVLVMHQLILDCLKTFAPFLRGYGINYIYFTVTFALCWISIPLMRRYLPMFTAQKDLLPFNVGMLKMSKA